MNQQEYILKEERPQQTIKKENPEITKRLIQQILYLKKKKNAIILVHNYQQPEMYEIADFIGDSLELSRRAATTNADIIVFCGVEFMAETAKILSPTKKVLLPTFAAGCSLADMATPEELIKVKKKHPHAAVVSYVNTTAAVKALSDACCTSMNALKVIESLPQEEIIFLPDKNMAKHLLKRTTKKIITWDGYCFVHNDLKREMIEELQQRFPGSKIIAHPECTEEILEKADCITGTGGMAKFAITDQATDFIIATECGMTEILKQQVPEKKFHAFCNICPYMKATTLSLVLDVLTTEKNEIHVPEDIRIKAKYALDKMLEIA